MAVEARVAVANWLNAQGKREDLDSETLTQVQTLFAPHRGFGILWSMIAFDRARDLEELKGTPLGSPQGVARASVLQGQIAAIDRLYEMLLDIADPTVPDDEGDKTNG